MWRNEDIRLYFSLFGASAEVLERVREEGVTQQDMSEYGVKHLLDLGISSKSVCSAMVNQWKTSKEEERPSLALEAIEQTMESFNQVLSYKAKMNEEMYPNVKNDAVDTLKHGNLLRIIREQEARIIELENRETYFLEELDSRADLIKQLEDQVLALEKATQEKALNAEEIRNYITENHALLHKKIDETKLSMCDIDQHIESILKTAKHTVEIIQEEERNTEKLDSTISHTSLKSRMIEIDSISIENIKKEGGLKRNIDVIGGVSLDPYVVFKLTDEAIESKKLHNSGPSPSWEKMNIELQAITDNFNKEYNNLIIEVWDSFSMNLSNELICSGMISFGHLDMLNGRGPVMTSVDLVNYKGDFVTTAKVCVNVTMAGIENDNGGGDSNYIGASSSAAKACFEVGDYVACNYGGEGEWLPGKILRYRRIRDRMDTRRLYEVEFTNGDVEVNVPISRVRETVPVKKNMSNPEEDTFAELSEKEAEGTETELSKLFRQNNSDLLKVVTDVYHSSQGTVSNILELDEWQKRLTKLLSDALRRYFEVNEAAKKYSVYVNSLTEKIGNIDNFLQRLEISERKSNGFNADIAKLRSEIEDLRKKLAEMTRLRDAEVDGHDVTKRLLEQEKQVTLECKKEIIDLRSELDHLIEVVRRDMSNRITNKNVNEELYSISSKLVKTDVQTSTPQPPVPVPVVQISNAVEHDDIFLQQHDWKLFLSLIKVDMTTQEVGEAHATLHNLNKSFEILSSRLLLECRHRAECELKLTGAKESLREIRDDIITEATLRLQLEEEMQFFKETVDQQKEEIEKHKKFSVIAKKAAYDAIKQARYYQRKLNIEIDNISDAGFGESKVSLNQDNKEQSGGSKKGSPMRSNKSSHKILNYDEFEGMFDDTDDDVSNGGQSRRKLTRSSTNTSTRGNPNSPYLNGRKKNRLNPYHNLQTRSENEKDFQASQASASSKKSKKIKIPGKKQMSYVGKKITRVLFDGKNGSRSSVGVTPCDDTSTSGRSSAKSPGKGWINPSYVNYAEKYGKEPPTAASRRTYIPQQQYD